MEIVAYNSIADNGIIEEIKNCGWSAGELLAVLLKENKLEEICGDGAKVYLLFEEGKLAAYCTYAPKDDIPTDEYSPWIGFVFTFPQYRNRGFARKLIEHIETVAKQERKEFTYISTNHIGLYERLGYEFFKIMPDINGESSRVYRKKL